MQHSAEPDRLGAQVDPEQLVSAARRVALVKDQVDDGTDGGQPGGERPGPRYLEPDPRRSYLALGPDEPLRQRRLGRQERGGDLPGGQSRDVPQRECHPDLRRQGGVAAGEDQPEPVVFHGDHLGVSAVGLGWDGTGLRGQASPGDVLLRPQLIDGLAPRGHRQPGARLRRYAVVRPGPRGRGERLGHGVLGGLQVAETPRQGGDDCRPLLAVSALERGRGYSRGDRHAWPSRTGRISTVPYRTIGILPAHSSAVSRSGTSSR